MGYKNPIEELTTEWYDLINGVSGILSVYKETVSSLEEDNYVIIRAEGQNTTKNHSGFFSNVVIIVEIVTKFNVSVDTSIVNTIDNIITELVFPTPNTFGIPDLTNHQIIDISLESSNYVSEDDGSNKYYTKISRYNHSLNQK